MATFVPGALGFQGKTADAVNIAAHQSLASGAALDNLVGLQGGFLTNGDAIDTNFITSQELEGGASNGHEYILTNDASSLVENVVKYNGEQANLGLVQATKYNDGPEYTSGSIILDDYRLPSQKTDASQARLQNVGATASYAQSTGVTSSVRKNTGKYDARYNTGYYKPQQLSGTRFSDGKYRPSNTGKYVHDPTGDRALPYNHVASPIVPYKHVDYGYTVTKGFDVGKYNGSWSYTDRGDKASDGYYYNKPTGPAFEEGGYNTGYTGTYNINGYVGTTDDSGAYDHSSAGHTLTAGAVNVGLVGKTTLVDVGYTGDEYENVKTGQVSYVSQPGVTINHVGTDLHNFDGYSFATNPTSSGIPTTATPFAVTTALPTVTTFKTTYVPLAPKTSIKQIFTVTPSPVTFATPKVEVTDYYLNTNYQSEIKASTGYDYAKPRIPFEEGISYTTAAPGIAVSTYKPQGFSHQQQTIHHVAADISSYSTPVTEVPFKKLVAYTTTGPTISSYSQTHGQQTNRFGSTNVFSTETGSTGYNQGESTVTFVQPQNVVQYTQTLPTASILPTVSTYQPQTFSQQTLHKVDASRINAFVQNGEASYQYTKPTGYDGSRQTVIQFTTPTPIVTSTYRPQAFSQQTLHRVVSSTVRPVVRKQYTYQTTPVTLYENPILKYTQKVFPQTIVSSTYAPQTYSQQTIQTGETAKTFGIDGGYTYTKSGVTYQQPQKVVEVSTIQPAIAVQPVVSTYQPQSYNQLTIHKVDAAQVNTYSQGAGVSGYFNTQPIVTLEDTAKTVVESSTAVPVVTSTYRPYTIRQRIQTQKLIPVSTTPLPKVELTYQPSVTIYENPILKYTQKVTPVTYVQPTATVFTQTTKPVQQYQTTGQTYNNLNVDVKQAGYTYSQPEIQTNIGSSKAYSDASVVSRQEFHLNTGNQYSSGKDVVFVSTTPSTLVYEDHYSTKDNTQSTAYIAPETKYQRTYTRPTVSVPVVNEHISTIYKTQDQYDYKPLEFSQQYDISQTVPAQVSVSQTTVELPRKTIFKQTAYQAPEIQVAYKGEDYLPPVVSTVTPIVTSTYQPSTYSTVGTSREYVPAVSKTTFEYNGPEYLPPQTTAKPTTKSREYLPPVAQTVFESKITNTPYQDYSVPQDTTVVSSTATPTYRKQNIVVETAKSQLLGFGSVGTDAGLVTPVTYSTAAPVVVSSTENYYVQPKVVTSTYAPELAEVTSSAPRRSRPKYFRPSVTSTTQAPNYEDAKSTTAYRGPDYLPPSENINQKLETIGLNNADVSYSQNLNVNPYQEYTISDATPVVISSTAAPLRKQTNLLGFGTVGPDAGLVTYTSSPAPSVGTYQTVSSTYAPIQEELVDVTPSLIPVRRTKPKVAVVTKINDFNPLLVRKLGAVCSCQSPVLVLKGRRPVVKQQEIYTNDYDTVTQSSRVQTPVVTTVVTPTPAVTSTYNPIIVPDDSFYQDYQDQASNDHIAIVPNGNDHGNYVSSTPAIISTTEKVVRIRPRVKTVTVAPTYRTVLLNEDVSPTVEIKGAEVTTDSQSFDRYGPGGWRGRDETLQGSVDCQRAGLFRHPKQCNKFYACRWDCTKQRFTLHVFNCPVQLSFDPNLGACNWPSQGPACQGDTLLTNTI